MTSPAELDDAGKVVRPSTSWHKSCIEAYEDARGEIEEGPYPGHEEGILWQPH